MDLILFFQPKRHGSWRQMLSGTQRYAKEHNWGLQIMARPSSDSDIVRAIRDWRPKGCIIDCSEDGRPLAERLLVGIPTVYLNADTNRHPVPHPILTHDSAATAKLAARELLSLGLTHYAYVPFPQPQKWSRIRERSFRSEIAATGFHVVTFHGGDLGQWLKRLPKPCGVMAANDPTALMTVSAALLAGIGVPDELAVIGVDNDEIFCESTMPGLTSIEIDYEKIGYRLGELLAREINGDGTHEVTLFKPDRIVKRGSTLVSSRRNPRVSLALEFIRRHGCVQKLCVDDVAEIMKCSRRLATKTFRETTGKSILEWIHDVRFGKLQRLLSTTSGSITSIIQDCGFSSESFTKRLFRKRTGMTMGDFRSRSRPT